MSLNNFLLLRFTFDVIKNVDHHYLCHFVNEVFSLKHPFKCDTEVVRKLFERTFSTLYNFAALFFANITGAFKVCFAKVSSRVILFMVCQVAVFDLLKSS